MLMIRQSARLPHTINTAIKSLTAVLLLTLFSLNAKASSANVLGEKLRAFQPYLGTWESEMDFGDGKKVTDVSRWERALNGNTIRTLHSIDNGMYGGESLIFFDASKQQIVFYYFTTADFYTNGTIEFVGTNEFIAREQVTNSAQGYTEVESRSTLSENKLIVSTRYKKTGKWTEPQERTYTRSTKTVKFK